MSTITATSDEPASFDGVSNDGLEMITPVSEPVEAIETQFIQAASNPEDNLTPGFVELTNMSNNSLSIVANDYQFLTDASADPEPPTHATDDVSQPTSSSNSLENSSSGDFQLTVSSDDQENPASVADDQQHSTDDTDAQQQPSNVATDICEPHATEPNDSDHQRPNDTDNQQLNNSDNQPLPVDTTDNHQEAKNKGNSAEKPKLNSVSPRPAHIPPHLMGRDVKNPAQDVVGTNRRVQKPRLGVKVPYRNLTSQIVTQDEIAQEILERQMRKYPYSDLIEGGDVLFAMKLTHRLAHKIVTTESVERKQLEAAKTVAATVASVTASSVSTKLETPTSASSVSPETDAPTSAKNPSTPTVTEPSNTNIDAETSKFDAVSSAVAEITATISSAPAVPAEKTSSEADKPTPDAASQSALEPDSSAADELYAEISSTLKEEYVPTATPVQIFSAAQLQAQELKTELQTSNNVNGSQSIHAETELDNDTLLAILEGTTDMNESCAQPSTVPPSDPIPRSSPVPPPSTVPASTAVPPASTVLPIISQTAIIATPTSDVEDNKKRKKRIKPILDPLLERELALKQLMAFDDKRKTRKPKTPVTPKVKARKSSTPPPTTPTPPQNGVVTPAKTNPVPVTPTSTSAAPVADSSKKTKRAANSYNVGSQAPKRFPKKYQRIIKQQLRSSKKMKTKNLSPDQQLTQQQQKKLPEVPEVQIAIDRYIKTYASKRKHKPDSPSSEKLVVKKMKTDAAASSAASATVNTKAAAAKASVAAGGAKTADAGAKVAAANAKSVAVSEKAASTKILASREKTAASIKKPTDACVETFVAELPDLTEQPAPPAEAMDIDENVAAEAPQDAEAAAQLAEKETVKAIAKTKTNPKMMREINRLLGDEGAINMIYSVEQKRKPGTRPEANVLPSVRRKKKDLQQRTKLVKDAVLRLSMLSSSQGTPTRTVRRTSPETTPDAAPTPAAAKAASTSAVAAAAAALRKASIESVESNSSELNNNSSSSFSTPRAAKTRQLAAEASRIIRRHSSSSAYSSDEDEVTAEKGPAGVVESAPSNVCLPAESVEKTTQEALAAAEKVDATSSECVPKNATVKAAAPVVEKKGASKSSDHLKVKSPATSRRASKEPPASVEPEESRVQPEASVNGSLGSGTNSVYMHLCVIRFLALSLSMFLFIF